MSKQPTKKPQTMKHNFAKVPVKVDIEGTIQDYDVAKALGNLVYSLSATLEGLDLSKRIHSGKPTELSDSDKEVVKQAINSERCQFYAMIKVGILDLLG